MANKSRNKNRRPQRPKDTGNRAMYDAFLELRQSSAAEPHRNRARYARTDERNMRQRGRWE